jgi:hypothetical protein
MSEHFRLKDAALFDKWGLPLTACDECVRIMEVMDQTFGVAPSALSIAFWHASARTHSPERHMEWLREKTS